MTRGTVHPAERVAGGLYLALAALTAWNSLAGFLLEDAYRGSIRTSLETALLGADAGIVDVTVALSEMSLYVGLLFGIVWAGAQVALAFALQRGWRGARIAGLVGAAVALAGGVQLAATYLLAPPGTTPALPSLVWLGLAAARVASPTVTVLLATSYLALLLLLAVGERAARRAESQKFMAGSVVNRT